MTGPNAHRAVREAYLAFATCHGQRRKIRVVVSPIIFQALARLGFREGEVDAEELFGDDPGVPVELRRFGSGVQIDYA